MTKSRKITKSDRQRLADPVTFAAIDATQKEARSRFNVRLLAIAADIKTMLAGRKPSGLSGADAVRFMSLKAKFDALAIEQKHFAEADLAARLRHGEGGAPVDA